MDEKAKRKYAQQHDKLVQAYKREMEVWLKTAKPEPKSPEKKVWNLRRNTRRNQKSLEKRSPKVQPSISVNPPGEESQRLQNGFKKYWEEKDKDRAARKIGRAGPEWAFQLQIQWNQLTEAQRSRYCDLASNKLGKPDTEQLISTWRPVPRRKSTRTSVILRRQATQQKMAKQNKQPEVATESKPRHSLPKQASLNRRQGRSLGRFTQA